MLGVYRYLIISYLRRGENIIFVGEGGGILFLDQFIGPLSFSLSFPSFIVVFFLQMSSMGTGRIFWYMHLRPAGDGGEWAQGCGSSDGPHSSQAPRPAGPSPHLHSPRPRRPPAGGSAACRRRLRPGRLAWCAAVPVWDCSTAGHSQVSLPHPAWLRFCCYMVNFLIYLYVQEAE